MTLDNYNISLSSYYNGTLICNLRITCHLFILNQGFFRGGGENSSILSQEAVWLIQDGLGKSCGSSGSLVAGFTVLVNSHKATRPCAR